MAPERFAVLQALLAYLLAACGEERRAEVDAQELIDRFGIPEESLQEHLSLLNLVNFGGGCYTVYAELAGDRVTIDKELYGDTFRAAPRLTPLEARAIRLALEFVGPMIAADTHTPLDRVRRKLEETFGQFELTRTPEPREDAGEEELIATLSRAIEQHRVVELEYLKESDDVPETRQVEPYRFQRELPAWRVHTWDLTRDGPRTYRLDRMRAARVTKESFEPRPGFDPDYMRHAASVPVLFDQELARFEVERGARLLRDGSALALLRAGSPEWLEVEILSYRGHATVLEPADLRRRLAVRAGELLTELGLTRVRGRTPARA